MSSKRQPGRPSRSQADKSAAFVGVADLPSDPLDVFEFRTSEPNTLLALFRVFGSYQCNLAYLVIEERQMRIVARSANQKQSKNVDELELRAHVVSGTFDCSRVFYYHAHPDVLGTYQLSLSEDRILSFVGNLSPSHVGVIIRIRSSDRSRIEIVLKEDAIDADEGTSASYLCDRVEPSFPIAPFFPENEHLTLPALSMTVPFDKFKKTIVMISKESPAMFEVFRAKERPLCFKWLSPANQRSISHAFSNEKIELVDNSTDRIVTLDVQTNDIKRFFTACKAPVSQVHLSIMADARVVIRSRGVPSLAICVFAGHPF